MNWWNSFVQWLSSSEGSRIVSDAILPFLAIVVAGVLAALIARSMGKRLLDLHEREAKAAAVTSLITVARKASVWNTLGGDERAHTDHLADEANVRLRLLPDAGAGLAAAWVEHEFVAIKNYSATFSFQSEQSFADLRERLVEWQAKPARARKLFRADLDRWKAEDESTTPQPPAHALDDAVNSEAASTSGQPSWAVTTPTGSTPATSANEAPPRPTAAPASAVSYDVTPADSTRIAPATEASASSVPADAQAPGSSQAATTPAEDVTTSVEPAPAATADAEGTSPEAAAVTPAGASAGAGADTADTASDTPPRRPTGMVSTPVVQPSRSVVPASPSDAADADAGDGTDREAAYSAPVSAQQVRRRTSPDA
jgi:hypothetical protein